jgi:hypothetical protein
MLTAKDRKYFETLGGRSGARMQVLQYSVPVVLTMTAVFNVWMASRWGHLVGYSLPALIRLCIAGTDLSKSYPGILIRAEDDLTLALLSLGMAVVTLAVAVQSQAILRRHLRIVDSLKRCGEL